VKLTGYITLILLLAACNGNKQNTSETITPLYPAPLKVALNTQEGYIINQVTGDSIATLLSYNGDTLKTGVPISVKCSPPCKEGVPAGGGGKTIHPDSVAEPKVVKAGQPKIDSTNLNIHLIPQNLTIIPINHDSLKTFTPGIDTSSFVLTNGIGDTIPTGIPIPANGKTMPATYPLPTAALPLRFKDAAIGNILYLDVDQGLNSSYVRSMLEDEDGNLWFGTYGGGVSKYDGKSFTHFTQKQGLNI